MLANLVASLFFAMAGTQPALQETSNDSPCETTPTGIQMRVGDYLVRNDNAAPDDRFPFSYMMKFFDEDRVEMGSFDRKLGWQTWINNGSEHQRSISEAANDNEQGLLMERLRDQYNNNCGSFVRSTDQKPEENICRTEGDSRIMYIDGMPAVRDTRIRTDNGEITNVFEFNGPDFTGSYDGRFWTYRELDPLTNGTGLAEIHDDFTSGGLEIREPAPNGVIRLKQLHFQYLRECPEDRN